MDNAVIKQLKQDYRDGFNAYNAGLSIHENPNEPGSFNFDNWQLGWQSARDLNS